MSEIGELSTSSDKTSPPRDFDEVIDRALRDPARKMCLLQHLGLEGHEGTPVHEDSGKTGLSTINVPSCSHSTPSGTPTSEQ